MLSSATSQAVLQLREIAVGNSGGVASVHIDGFEQLMPIFIGVAEAAALVYATTRSEGRRPSTLGTWKRSLEVDHDSYLLQARTCILTRHSQSMPRQVAAAILLPKPCTAHKSYLTCTIAMLLICFQSVGHLCGMLRICNLCRLQAAR